MKCYPLFAVAILFHDVENLCSIINPIKKAIIILEHKKLY